MRLRKILISTVAPLGIGAAVLAASPAYAVNTSEIIFNTTPLTEQPVACAFNTFGAVQHPAEIIRVVNNCSVRMWLHQYANGSGRALCINPGTTAEINRTYRQWQVTSNQSDC